MYCSQGQNCVNSIGSYTCHDGCSTGYRQRDGACIDINECAEGTHNCGISEQCKNRAGSFRCETQNCPQGYQKDSRGNCNDIDECAQGIHECPGTI